MSNEDLTIVLENHQWEAYGEPQFKVITFDTAGERDAYLAGFGDAINWDQDDLSAWTPYAAKSQGYASLLEMMAEQKESPAVETQ